MKNIRKIFYIVQEDKWLLVGVVLANLFIGLGTAYLPIFYKSIVDTVIQTKGSSGALPRVFQVLFLLGSVRLAIAVAEYFQEKLSDNIFNNTITKLRRRTFEKVVRLSIDYYEKNQVGAIVQKVSGSIQEFMHWLQSVSEDLFLSMLTVLFAVVVLTFVDWRAGLVMIIALPLGLLTTVIKVKLGRPIWKEVSINREMTQAHLTETVTHISTVRSFVNERVSIDNFSIKLENLRKLAAKGFSIQQNANFLRKVIAVTALVLAVGFVSAGAVSGTHTPGDVLLAFLYVQQITNNLNPIARLILRTGEVDASATRMVELLSVNDEVSDKKNATPVTNFLSLEFKNVGFKYPGKRRTVLENISFRLNKGESLALVGISGAGKTTITKLIMRFYEPSSGTILINGKNADSFTQESIRGLMGVVLQDVALFNDTVEVNLKFADPSLSPKKVREAAKIAHADVFIDKLPNKYKSLVGERGVKLSGGEKQRVAVARAILKNPKLIILDEATSSLDSQSEKYVQDGLKKLMTGRTAVVIAHRLSTVMRADQILVLENGQIVEHGTHSDLLKKKGLYSKLFKLQSLR